MDCRNYPLLYHQSSRVTLPYLDCPDSRLPPSYDMHQENKQHFHRANYSMDCRPAHLHIEASNSYDVKCDKKNTIVFNPPSWASPARGESSLEPIGDTKYTNKPINLTVRTYFRIGRSPNSHVPLLHSTSSRRHALIFHHTNGSCYIIDCQSTHGTYVDGVRVKPYPHPPKRVRRGALLRFGGPGAPKFVLKSFSVKLKKMVNDLGGVAEAYFPKHYNSITDHPHPITNDSSASEDDESVKTAPFEEREDKFSVPLIDDNISIYNKRPQRTESNGMLACIRGDGGGVACIADGLDAPEAALVLLNTRLNAVGRYAMGSESDRLIARSAQLKFENMGIKRKRNSPEHIIQDQIIYNTTHLLKRPKRSILKSIENREYESFHNICTTPKAEIGQHNRITPNQTCTQVKSRRRVSFVDEVTQSRKPIITNATPQDFFMFQDDIERPNLSQGLALPVL